MNNKGSIITIVSLKTYIILIILLIVVILLYPKISNFVNTSISSSSSYCKNIIPDRMKLNPGTSNYRGGIYYGVEEGSTWKDGTAIDILKISFEEGRSKNQNVNHVYSNSANRGFVYNYHNKIIDESGNIKEDLYYLVELEIDLKDKVDDGYKVVSYKCKSYKPFLP